MLPYNNKLKNRSQELRKNATKEERHLWYDFLKTFHLQFQRQKVIGNFIVDFYCEKAKLVIELDGAQHFEENVQIYDNERTAYLNGLGIAVIRFNNLDIQKNFSDVCAMIQIRIDELLIQPSSVAFGDSFPQGKP
ncbi:DUF559 domain-containing protein [Oscillospiraceae bacterium WX1]